MNKIQSDAQRIFDQTRVSDEVIAVYGRNTLPPISFATLDEITAWLQTIEEARAAFNLNYLAAEQIPWGATREQIFAIAESKRKNSNRRAGARALIAKYGKEAAENIIERHTGRRYNLKG